MPLCSLKIEQRLAQAQTLTQGWEEIKHMKAELWIYLQDADQQLQNMRRRHAELELNIAQNMVSQVKVGKSGDREGQDGCVPQSLNINRAIEGIQRIRKTFIWCQERTDQRANICKAQQRKYSQ